MKKEERIKNYSYKKLKKNEKVRRQKKEEELWRNRRKEKVILKDETVYSKAKKE